MATSSLLLATLMVVSAGAVHVSRRGVQQKTEPQVKPELDPMSHNLFMRNDYPHDLKPPINKDFDFNHPYPLVQDTDAFDKDYVKDENSDSGEWKAQMEYDILRNKVWKAKADAELARKAMERMQRMKEEAERKMAEAEAKAAAARAKAEAAEKAMKAAEDKVEQIDAEHAKAENGDVDSTGVKDAQDQLAKDIDDLEECKRKLAEAKEKLKKLMSDKEKADAKLKAAQEEEAKKHAADKANADKNAEMSEEEAKKALEQAKKAQEDAKKAAEEIKRNKNEYEDAHKKYQSELDEVERDEKAIEEAKKRLKALRAKQIAEHSGISRVDPDADPGCVCPGGGSGSIPGIGGGEGGEHGQGNGSSGDDWFKNPFGGGGGEHGAHGDRPEGCPPCPIGNEPCDDKYTTTTTGFMDSAIPGIGGGSGGSGSGGEKGAAFGAQMPLLALVAAAAGLIAW